MQVLFSYVRIKVKLSACRLGHDVPGGVVIGLSMGLGDVTPRTLSNLKLSQQWNLSWWGLCE